MALFNGQGICNLAARGCLQHVPQVLHPITLILLIYSQHPCALPPSSFISIPAAFGKVFGTGTFPLFPVPPWLGPWQSWGSQEAAEPQVRGAASSRCCWQGHSGGERSCLPQSQATAQRKKMRLLCSVRGAWWGCQQLRGGELVLSQPGQWLPTVLLQVWGRFLCPHVTGSR